MVAALAVACSAVLGIGCVIRYWINQPNVSTGLKVHAICLQSTGIMLVMLAISTLLSLMRR